jgi:hypothetical protein
MSHGSQLFFNLFPISFQRPTAARSVGLIERCPIPTNGFFLFGDLPSADHSLVYHQGRGEQNRILFDLKNILYVFERGLNVGTVVK